MGPASASTVANPVSAATRCRSRCVRAGAGPTTSTGRCSRSTPTGPTAASPLRSASNAGSAQSMTWFDAEIDSSMMAIRAIHFAATAAIAGALVFRAVVAEPALRYQREASAVIEPQIRKVAWTGLVVVITSGVGWVLLLTMSLSGESVGEAIMSGALSDVVTLTQFGIVAQVRLALAIALGICLTLDRFPLARWLALGAALCLIASIAWTGHAASTPHALGYVHLAADALHLYAASAWIGGLAPLALLLRIGRRYHASAWVKLELEAVRRFSSLGMASVAVLI